LHFGNQQKILRFFVPIMGGGGLRNFVSPFFCAAAHFLGRTRTRAVNPKIFFLRFRLFLYQNETTASCQDPNKFFTKNQLTLLHVL
jgi:hypothetical protein